MNEYITGDHKRPTAEENDNNNAFDGLKVEQGLDFSNLMNQTDNLNNASEDQQQSGSSQQIDMLWSNLLNNPAIQQFANGIAEREFEQHQKEEDDQMNYNEQQERNELGNNDENGGEGDQLDQTEILANLVGEKVMVNKYCQININSNIFHKQGYITIQFENKFDFIIDSLNSLKKSIDEVKRSVGTQQRRIIPPPPKLNPIKPNPMNMNNGDASSLLRPFLPSLAKQQKNNIQEQQQGNAEKGQQVITEI